MIIWRITDGKAGHDAQSRGLTEALNTLVACSGYEITAPSFFSVLIDFFSRRFSAGAGLPDPDIILGAGHATHLPMLAAHRARGGKTVVLMRPSLPVRWFDLCLIPEHDRPATESNVIATRGALNQIVPSAKHRPDRGLILIGGSSRHYGWDNDDIIEQVLTIIKNDPRRWTITDSPRTPASTRHGLLQLTHAALEYVPYVECPPGWLQHQLCYASAVWVTRDSISMVYEALTAGAAVGLLVVPEKKNSRVVRAIHALIESKQVTAYPDWRDGGAPLSPLATPLYESKRCARLVLERFSLMGHE